LRNDLVDEAVQGKVYQSLCNELWLEL